MKRHTTSLKWIKFLQSPFPLGFNDNILAKVLTDHLHFINFLQNKILHH